MSRKKDANKYWIYGEDAALAARFTKYLTKVLYSHLDYASKVSSAEAMLNGLGMGSNPGNDT